jgi:hypothetical protein
VVIMVVRARLGDRREAVRLSVRGQLWASLELTEQIILRNIALGGALIEARLPAGLKAIRAVQIELPDHGPTIEALVRHVSPVEDAAREDWWVVGLEFMKLSPAARADLDRLMREWDEVSD